MYTVDYLIPRIVFEETSAERSPPPSARCDAKGPGFKAISARQLGIAMKTMFFSGALIMP